MVSATEAEPDDDFKGCPAEFPTFEPGLHSAGAHLSANVLGAMPAEPERYLNDWTVELTADGAPAMGASIVRGQTFMPVHGHDGGVQPQPKSLTAPGQFEVDRLNFTMRGPWEVRLWLSTAAKEDDYLVFKVCVAK
jgi:hypothetical protein